MLYENKVKSVSSLFQAQHRLLPGKLYDEKKFEDINHMILGRKSIEGEEQPKADNLRVGQEKLDRFNFCQTQLNKMKDRLAVKERDFLLKALRPEYMKGL